jgi:hypothetical protein
MGIETVLPKSLVRSDAIVGAEYPDGALVAVDVVASYEE